MIRHFRLGADSSVFRLSWWGRLSEPSFVGRSLPRLIEPHLPRTARRARFCGDLHQAYTKLRAREGVVGVQVFGARVFLRLLVGVVARANECATFDYANSEG